MAECKKKFHCDDPLERAVIKALDASGVEFVHDSQDNKRTHNLDFYLPRYDVFVEVKQFHSDRIAEQMSRAPNVIALQGVGSVALFSILLARLSTTKEETPT